MTIERYSHVMHITSNVTGQLAAGQDGLRRLAGLPAGRHRVRRPKVRAMEIIDELEPHRRGPYAGAVGYVDFNGNMDTCIALRTMVVQGDRAYVQAGAGHRGRQRAGQRMAGDAQQGPRAVEGDRVGAVAVGRKRAAGFIPADWPRCCISPPNAGINPAARRRPRTAHRESPTRTDLRPDQASAIPCRCR